MCLHFYSVVSGVSCFQNCIYVQSEQGLWLYQLVVKLFIVLDVVMFLHVILFFILEGVIAFYRLEELPARSSDFWIVVTNLPNDE